MYEAFIKQMRSTVKHDDNVSQDGSKITQPHCVRYWVAPPIPSLLTSFVNGPHSEHWAFSGLFYLNTFYLVDANTKQ